MTVKTEQLLSEMTEALFDKKAVLLTGNTGVGKTYLARKIAEKMGGREYSCFPSSPEQSVRTEIISCHNGVTYEDIVSGITADTEAGKMVFEYKDKVMVKTLADAAKAYHEGSGAKFVLIFDDMQRNDMSSLFGDAVGAIGAGAGTHRLCLNFKTEVEITPNFYIIGTYNAAETGAVPMAGELFGKFYVREILSDIRYITEDSESESTVFYEQTRSMMLRYLDMQYQTSVYEQNRYLPGHGYFSGDNVILKIKYQLIPLLKQYIAEGILDSASEAFIRMLERACNDKKKETVKTTEESCFDGYKSGVTAGNFLAEGSVSVPLENLIGRIIDQRLLTNDEIKRNLLFNTRVCYKEKESDGVTYQGQLLAAGQAYQRICRSSGDRRKWYNGGTIKIDGKEYHFTGGMQATEYTVKNPGRRMNIWDITDGYKTGETTSPNVILYRLIWQYYKTLTDNLDLYLEFHPTDEQKKNLLDFIRAEWETFLADFKRIRPRVAANADKKAENKNNEEANRRVRELISSLRVLWSNPGDKLEMLDGSEIILEGVVNDMDENVYQEYRDAMELLGIKQMILQGPPGTSKTYSAKEFLKFMAGNCSEEDLAAMQIIDYTKKDKYCDKLIKENIAPEIAWDIVQFHPSYGYEDFIRGIQVSTKQDSETISYETVNKVLGNIAELAKEYPGRRFFLIIDEINRANLATVFGELIYGLEYREEPVATPYTVEESNKISLPDNLYIIGTMNTADKSIGGIDYAIRRRFLFFEQLPDKEVIRAYRADSGEAQAALNEKAVKLFENVQKLFEEGFLSPEYRREDVQIGHTYFLADSEEKLLKRFEYQIIPILKEYYKDGIITSGASDETEEFNGFLNCIAGKINMTTQKEKIAEIFNELIS